MSDTSPPVPGNPLPGNGSTAAAGLDDATWHDDPMRRHWKHLHGWAKNKVPIIADAEDIAQFAVLVAWIKRDLVNSPAYEPLWPWLIGVTRNLLRNSRSRQLAQHRWSYLVTLDDEVPVPDSAMPAGDVHAGDPGSSGA